MGSGKQETGNGQQATFWEVRPALSAYRFALERHRGQTYGDKFYVDGHLLPVAQTLYRLFCEKKHISFDFWLNMDELGESSQVLVCAFLHDIVEDTGTSLLEVKEFFGERVARVVDLVTTSALGADGRPLSPKASRKKRLFEWNLKWLEARSDPSRASVLQDARAVKLADRLCNVEACWAARDSRLFMYRDEHPVFEQVVLKQAEPTPLLEDLSSRLCALLSVPRFEPSSWKR